MNFFVLPKMTSAKNGQVIRHAERGNRFRVVFSLGSMGACVTDAQRVIDLGVENLISHIRLMWMRGNRADGTVMQRKTKRRIYGISRHYMELPEIAVYENMVLDGTFKTPRAEPGAPYLVVQRINRLKQWIKDTKKKYTWGGTTYRPNATKRPGNWSGLLMDSLTAEKVKILRKNNKTPTQVSVRITVSPKRRDAVLKLHMMRLNENAFIMRDLQRMTQNAARNTGIFKSWQAGDVKEVDLMAVWNQFKAGYRMANSAISAVSRIGRML